MSHRMIQFPATVLFLDHACFTRERMVNMHNMHVWLSENTHRTVLLKMQHKFGINIWVGILGYHLLGPHLLPKHDNGANYLVFIQHVFPDLMQGIPATVCQNIFPATVVHNHFNATYLGMSTKCGGPAVWPSGSQKQNPLDFFCGYLKLAVYQMLENTTQDRTAWTATSATTASTVGMFKHT
ncbi:hypothetical protein X975_04385, partial [Stegodyphus mimosarum]